MSWVNIWKDDEAAAFVASHRNGHETVPTAVTGAGVVIEATPSSIRAHLGY